MEKHGAGEGEARRMLDSFASLGVGGFDVTETDMDGRKRRFFAEQKWERLRQEIGGWIESAVAGQQNLIIRPRGSPLEMIQLDDLDEMMMERVRTAAFLIVATSPGNHQAWVAVRECSRDWVRRLRRGSGADTSASGATRVAGSVNFKRRYAPEFPRVRLLAAQPDHIVKRSELEHLGLVAAVVPGTHTARMIPASAQHPKHWPSYEACLKRAPLAHNSDRPDVSRADFTFCLIALDWGWSEAETRQRLLELSSKARVVGESYAQITVRQAAEAVNRRRRYGVPV